MTNQLPIARRIFLGLALMGLLVGQNCFAGDEHLSFASPSGLTAKLDGNNIDLSWKNNATAPGGAWLEFTTPGADYVKLDAFWPSITSYRHPDLAPETKHIYRLKPFFGKPSEIVSITSGKAPVKASAEEEGPLPPLKDSKSISKKSIRSAATFADAVPTGLTAKLSSPTSVELRWEDRASDEDGYLVEVSDARNGDFKICALLPPDTASFRKIQLPPEMNCYFRVRAFFYGQPSNIASATTPPEKKSLSLK